MSNPSPAPTRPGGVTLVVVLTYLSGILGLLEGLWLLVARGSADVERETGFDSGTLLTLGIVVILIAVFVILLAGALGRGSGGARLIVGFVMVARLLVGIWGVVAIHSATRWSSLLNALLALAVLLLLYSASANAWFASKKY